MSSKKIASAVDWRATITPLASIIGSGFLVIGPLLHHSFGRWSPLVMLALCFLAYLFGGAIRYNMQAMERQDGAGPSQWLERISSWALGFAYIISVTYYLNLFGAFAVSLTTVNTPVNAKLVTTAILLLIVVTGWLRGFSALEKLEQGAVTLKLSVIAGLIAGLIYYNISAMSSGTFYSLPSKLTGWQSITLIMGLMVTVQGFETSRYLGNEYATSIRIRTMRYSQLISTAIYFLFVCLITYVFPMDSVQLSDTAIIDMMKVVAPILPMLLIAAALASQFSAAVADTGGSGGLFEEVSKGRITVKYAYAILALIGVGLTWASDVFAIISYASRAFAFYYSIQSAIALFYAWQQPRNSLRVILFFSLTMFGLLAAVFGAAVES
ncbi:MAG: hypothetical protein ACWA5L_03280 [bacterium]